MQTSVLAIELQNLCDFEKRSKHNASSSILWYCFLNQIMKKMKCSIPFKDMHSDLPTDLLTDSTTDRADSFLTDCMC